MAKNPFDYLKRDSDVEGMSDGFDETTAYGNTYGVCMNRLVNWVTGTPITACDVQNTFSSAG